MENKYISKAVGIVEQSAYTDAQRMAYDKFWDEIVSERTLMKGYFRQGHAEGRAEGRAEGLAEGEKKGRAEGHAQGRAEGLAEGLAEGRAEGLAEGRVEGLAEGEKKGRKEQACEIAKKLIEMHLPMDSIIQATGLSKDEITSLM